MGVYKTRGSPVDRYIFIVVQVAPDDGLNESNVNEEGNPL